MDFLKNLFNGEALTFEQLSAKVADNKLNVVNLADGGYVSKQKFDDRTAALNQQIADLQGQLTQRDNDMQDLNGKLTQATADASKLAEAQTALTTLQGRYDADRQEWDAKIKKQQYEFLVAEKAASLKFSSAAAKRDFIREANGKDFKIDGESLLGYDDFVTKYKAENPGALAEETPNNPAPPAPEIVLPPSGLKEPDKTPFRFAFNGVRPKPDER